MDKEITKTKIVYNFLLRLDESSRKHIRSKNLSVLLKIHEHDIIDILGNLTMLGVINRVYRFYCPITGNGITDILFRPFPETIYCDVCNEEHSTLSNPLSAVYQLNDIKMLENLNNYLYEWDWA